MRLGKRHIDGDNLLARAESVEGAKEDGPAWEVIETIRRILTRSSKGPRLVGRARAAEILGVSSPYITDLIDSGDMPPAVLIEGAHPAYDLDAVKALAKKRKRERAQKEAKA